MRRVERWLSVSLFGVVFAPGEVALLVWLACLSLLALVVLPFVSLVGLVAAGVYYADLSGRADRARRESHGPGAGASSASGSAAR